MDGLRGKVAVVTGSASGIGQAVATRAASEGMRVVLADIEEEPLQKTAAALAEQGADVLAVPTDVSVAESVEALRDRALEAFGAVHLVHNNAGVGAGGLLWEVTVTDWAWVLGVNLWGVIHGIRAFVPLLVAQSEGHVVNTASLAGLTSPALLGPYNATKHAVVTISETLHRELQMVGSPVGVSVLCPGFVQTGIADSDRNRPHWAPRPAADDARRELTRQLIAGGMPAAEVADHVFDAVSAGRFYVLTHPDMLGMVETRMQDILDGRPPGPAPIA